MATISIDESTRKKLLSIAADLQKEYGERVDFDRVIDYLTESYESKKPRLEYWDQFTKGISGVKFEDAYRELMRERRRDERSLQRKLRR
ncbi:MAG TPA: hypothetical protein VFE98_04520 [Candidatus Bathyarchaeia archaeon]|nr:hypothetical protein [Candidatus Bathyarchaeia archaeon]